MEANDMDISNIKIFKGLLVQQFSSIPKRMESTVIGGNTGSYFSGYMPNLKNIRS